MQGALLDELIYDLRTHGVVHGERGNLTCVEGHSRLGDREKNLADGYGHANALHALLDIASGDDHTDDRVLLINQWAAGVSGVHANAKLKTVVFEMT